MSKADVFSGTTDFFELSRFRAQNHTISLSR